MDDVAATCLPQAQQQRQDGDVGLHHGPRRHVALEFHLKQTKTRAQKQNEMRDERKKKQPRETNKTRKNKQTNEK